MTGYNQPTPECYTEGSKGVIPTGFQEESESDSAASCTLTSPQPKWGCEVERLQEQIQILEIHVGRAEQKIQDKCL